MGRIRLWVLSDLRVKTSTQFHPEDSHGWKGFRALGPIKLAARPQDLVPPCPPRLCFVTTLLASYPGAAAGAMLSLGQHGDPQRDGLPSSQALSGPRMNQILPPGNVSLPSFPLPKPPPRRGLRSGWWEWAKGGGSRGSSKTPMGRRTEWGAKDDGARWKLLYATWREEREQGWAKNRRVERGGGCVCLSVCLSSRCTSQGLITYSDPLARPAGWQCKKEGGF